MPSSHTHNSERIDTMPFPHPSGITGDRRWTAEMINRAMMLYHLGVDMEGIREALYMEYGLWYKIKTVTSYIEALRPVWQE